MSEGGISWVPGLLDRMGHLLRHRDNKAYYGPRFGLDITPTEVLRRNFWFCEFARDFDSATVATLAPRWGRPARSATRRCGSSTSPGRSPRSWRRRWCSST
ncbi:hypothetical protein FRACA_610008 [Frankia canadensis]|uniref:Uncharacterized protein n=1 Tax=Frankia canadensis TaxID=1836972 RepID=A0A2I2KZP6_9ACTN|nr:hypothetical protein [Frankia canadensis]SNQ51127.1 hypothetical protein FRACA_610008 [Frankia canadensis]SOU58417.1 hypothetical protein FRACA_610008 [Frankia canadensis]